MTTACCSSTAQVFVVARPRGQTGPHDLMPPLLGLLAHLHQWNNPSRVADEYNPQFAMSQAYPGVRMLPRTRDSAAAPLAKPDEPKTTIGPLALGGRRPL